MESLLRTKSIASNCSNKQSKHAKMAALTLSSVIDAYSILVQPENYFMYGLIDANAQRRKRDWQKFVGVKCE